MIRSVILSLFILLGFNACVEPALEPDLSRLGFDYYPLQVGNYSVYEVNTVTYSNFGEIIFDTFYIKQQLVDSFLLVDGTLAYVQHLSSKNQLDQVWKLDSVWQVSRTAHHLVIKQSNVPILSLVFPVKAGNRWNGNAFNNLPEQEFYIENFNQDLEVGERLFENTISVVQLDIPDLIVNKQYKKEVFSKNIGLVYKEFIYLEFDTSDQFLGQQKIMGGREYRQTLIETGNE